MNKKVAKTLRTYVHRNFQEREWSRRLKAMKRAWHRVPWNRRHIVLKNLMGELI